MSEKTTEEVFAERDAAIERGESYEYRPEPEKKGKGKLLLILAAMGPSIVTAMAGTVGSGGLGDYAIRYGYQRVMTDVTVVTIIVVLLMVTIIQTLGTFLERVTTH